MMTKCTACGRLLCWRVTDARKIFCTLIYEQNCFQKYRKILKFHKNCLLRTPLKHTGIWSFKHFRLLVERNVLLLLLSVFFFVFFTIIVRYTSTVRSSTREFIITVIVNVFFLRGNNAFRRGLYTLHLNFYLNKLNKRCLYYCWSEN